MAVRTEPPHSVLRVVGRYDTVVPPALRICDLHMHVLLHVESARNAEVAQDGDDCSNVCVVSVGVQSHIRRNTP